MRKKKDGLSVAEAKQQLKDSAAGIQPKQLVVNNLWQVAVACFVAGMLSADSVKIRENLVSVATTALKKMI